MRSLAIGLLAAGLLGGAAHADARADGACMWNHISTAGREQFYAAYASGARDAWNVLQPHAVEFELASSVCGVNAPPERKRRAAKTVVLVGVASADLKVLQARYGISEKELIDAWAQVPAPERDGFAQFCMHAVNKTAATERSSDEKAAAFQAVRTALAHLKERGKTGAIQTKQFEFVFSYFSNTVLLSNADAL